MFVLQNVSGPRECDGHVHFTWLPERTTFVIESSAGHAFLELRLGYPQSDAEKRISISSPLVEGGQRVLPIRKGWNSYFIPLARAGASDCQLIINKPLVAPGETRFCGAMLSYAAVTDDRERIREIHSVNAQIDSAVEMKTQCGSVEEWVGRLYQTVLSREDEFYSERALDVPTIESLRDPVGKLSILNKRERWIIDRVRGGVVVELGTGRGGLVQLKDKPCELIGIDLSMDNCVISKRRGYDACLNATGTRLPLASGAIDYVVSADVLGHVPLDLKPPLAREIWRVLKPGGECLHVIETDEFDPLRMPPDEFVRMVVVDGHVGITSRAESEKLFGDTFEIIDSFMVSNAWMSLAHSIRAHDLYGANLPGEVLSLMLNATPRERQFFDLGVGWTFWSAFGERHEARATGGTLFLHARKRS